MLNMMDRVVVFQSFFELRSKKQWKGDVYGPLSNCLEAIRGEKRSAYGRCSDSDGEKILRAAFLV